MSSSFGVRSVHSDDHDWVVRLLTKEWGSPMIVTRGRSHQAETLPGFVAEQAGRPIGLLTYRIEKDECEIISLNSLVEGIGVGAALMSAVKEAAAAEGCRRIWLITTNDNLKAIRFYQKLGYALVAVHRNALEQSRLLKPSISLVGMDGIPLRDEIELEALL